MNFVINYDILSTTAGRFEKDCLEVLKSAQESSCKQIEIDMVLVKAIDSRGLNSIVSFVKLAKEKNIEIIISIAQPFVKSIFTLTRMNKILNYKEVNCTSY